MIISLAGETPFAQSSLVPLLEAEIHYGIWGTFGMDEGDFHSSLMHDEWRKMSISNGFEARPWQAMGEEMEDCVCGSLIGDLAGPIERGKPDDRSHTLDVEIAAACLWMIQGSGRARWLSEE
ncbi:hypothetical protein Tdes44962_MAKER00900 [Teratosphaeria destructans]|uniref:Uncharacterized protein n=1 Tax=Teratosphaeria destructans TaxID=418781 RepID=A0A9W7VYJ3_9PEZI|nr:hypothetical protein Tdes44962_MAKER00900 [Teratosphaeria destructans]